jgi:hypothetical protein
LYGCLISAVFALPSFVRFPHHCLIAPQQRDWKIAVLCALIVVK